MANIGDTLTAPEAGWKRIDDTDPCFKYTGDSWTSFSFGGFYGGTSHTNYPKADAIGIKIQFKFKGSKIRLINQANDGGTKDIEIKIDGVMEKYTQYATNTGTSGTQRIGYEKQNLEYGLHTVEITKTTTGIMHLDAIDIDDTGEVYPIIGTPLNLTAIDGGGQANLAWNAAADATSYTVKRSLTAGGPYTTIATGVKTTSYVDKDIDFEKTYYYVVTAVNSDAESNNSNEASVTIADNRKFLLRITMNDSSEREYQRPIKEVEAFIAWCNRSIGTGTAYYIFDKLVGTQNSKEYLFFEKIISFEVMECK